MQTDHQYPIGKYEAKPFSVAQKQDWISAIRFLPNALEAAIHNLDEAQLHTPYRDGSWTVHQLVHHIADSHLNAYCRFKLGYTEVVPTIKTYEEAAWATTADVQNLPVNISITLLYALHLRWTEFLASLQERDWNRTVYHPAKEQEVTLWYLLGLYAWHSRHHVAHVTALRARMAW